MCLPFMIPKGGLGFRGFPKNNKIQSFYKDASYPAGIK